jgi:hypothetical protein
MTADWTSKTLSGGFVVLLSSKEDAQRITKKFKVDPTPKRTLVSDETFLMGYRDSGYAALAAEMGYSLPKRKQP